MRDLRNPFRLQSAENIDSDTDFIKLFGPGVLDLLSQDAPFARPQFIRSAPGGGKTSLLKLFTPNVLNTLVLLRQYQEHRDLFHRLRQLGAVDDSGASVVGIMLPCGRTFPALADLGLPPARSRRLLMALLDSRIMLGALKSAITVRRLRYPDDLHRIQITVPDGGDLPGLPQRCDGFKAREWAQGLEQSICNIIDSLAKPEADGPIGHDRILMLELLDSDALMVDADVPGARWLLMLDDVQKLTREQRAALRETVLEQRSKTTVWTAERLEALSPDELLSQGALAGRDYGDVINLEEAWRKTPKRFEVAVSLIAERRARMAADVATGDAPGSFAAVIDGNPDAPERVSMYATALTAVANRVRSVALAEPRFREWVAARDEIDGTPREKLLAWRALEILIERDRRRNQQSFDFALGREQLDDKDDSGLKAAAEVFVAREFKLPYYYGASRLASLASFNVEQYLSLAGDLFEEALSAALLHGRRGVVLPISAQRQEQILSRAYDERMEDLPRRADNGRDVLQFVTVVGTFCREVTYQPNAPYAPGVNGIAISMQERQTLLDEPTLRSNPAYARFARLLATALSYNLLHAELDKSVKNQRWMILYLNRVLCMKFGLPLGFGGFRERPLKELISWMERGTLPRKQEGLGL